ncbi:integral membrane protein [Paraphaeosphaeria sporulosa]
MGTSARGRTSLEVSSVFTALAAIAVVLRLYTRFFIVRFFSVEDHLIALAMLCSIGLTICIGTRKSSKFSTKGPPSHSCVEVKYGMGHHMADLGPDGQPNALKAFFGSLIVYYLSLGFTKVSVVLQYRRVFPLRSVQIACWAILSIVISYTIWTVLGSVFACIPVRAFWTKEEGASCLNQSTMWYTNAAINIVTDFIIILLPMPVIKSLHLARRQKMALYIIFAVGGIVCIMSILRLQSLAVIANSADPLYDNPPAATWSSVETNVGIVCSCLPCLRPLIARYFPSIFASSRKSSGLPAHSRRRSRAAYLRQTEQPTMLEDLPSRVENRIGACDEGTVKRIKRTRYSSLRGRVWSALKGLEEELDKQNICLRDLRSTDSPDDKKRIEDTKGALLTESYRWILENSDSNDGVTTSTADYYG